MEESGNIAWNWVQSSKRVGSKFINAHHKTSSVTFIVSSATAVKKEQKRNFCLKNSKELMCLQLRKFLSWQKIMVLIKCKFCKIHKISNSSSIEKIFLVSFPCHLTKLTLHSMINEELHTFQHMHKKSQLIRDIRFVP